MAFRAEGFDELARVRCSWTMGSRPRAAAWPVRGSLDLLVGEVEVHPALGLQLAQAVLVQPVAPAQPPALGR